jgi:uroporphyrinogen decarboxylase
MQALLTPGVKPDRVPFIPFIFGFTALNCGWSIKDCYLDARRSFTAMLRTQEQYEYDGGPLYGYAAVGPWEFGGEVKMPTGEFDQAPTILKYAVETEDDVDRLRVPEDIMQAGAVPIMYEFCKLQDSLGMPVTVQMGSAFTMAANTVEPSRFLRWMVKKPDVAHQLLRVVTDFLVQLGRKWVELFPGRMITAFDGGPTESNDLISKKQFEEFALPYYREIHEKSLAAGITHFFTHACGEQNLNLPLYREIEFGQPGGPPGMLSVGHEVDLTRAIEVMGDKAVILGNVEPAQILCGEPEVVWELTKEAVLKGRDAPVGYVLMSGCDVPPNAPPYNMFTMLKAARYYGQY